MTRPVELAQVKEEASFKQILQHYSLKVIGSGKQRMVLCPFHADTTPSCSIHLERNVFHCFGCNAKGSVLDFVARMENVSIRDAAARVKDICGLRREGPARQTLRATRSADSRDPALPLRPLPFRLKLDPTHPYLSGRGIRPELAAQLGLGYSVAEPSCRAGFAFRSMTNTAHSWPMRAAGPAMTYREEFRNICCRADFRNDECSLAFTG